VSKPPDLDEWFAMIARSYSAPPVEFRGKALPGFPSDAVQVSTTGHCGIATLREAFDFYCACLTHFAALGRPIENGSRLLDFGAGWGRVSRFFLRDVAPENLHGLDVTPELSEICRTTFESPNFVTCGPFPPSTA